MLRRGLTMWIVVMLAHLLWSCKDDGGGGRSGDSGDPATGLEVDENGSDEGANDSTLVLDAQNATVTLNAESLVLSSNISTRPANADGSLGLYLATSDLDAHNEETFVWDPAQEPLKAMNKILCVLSRTAYHLNANKGSYVAKVTMKDCMLRDTFAAGGGGGQSSAPYDVTVISTKPKNKALQVKMWFTIEESMANGMAPASGMQEDEFNYYAHIYIAEPVSADNPYGLFFLRWDAYLKEQGQSESSAQTSWGYVDVTRTPSSGKIQLKYRETTRHEETWSWWDGTQNIDETWVNSMNQQAIAQVKVSNGIASSGEARTATNYSWALVSGTGNGYSGTDESGTYSSAFNLAEDRAMTKWIPASSYDQNGTWASGWDATAPRCERISDPVPTVYTYVPFTASGDYLNHQIGTPVENFDGTGWPGWIDNWGFYPPEGVEDGDKVYLVSFADGSRTEYFFTELSGELKNDNWENVTISQSTNLTLDCTSNCPKSGGITQAMLDANTQYLGAGTHTYVFNATTKKLTLSGVDVEFASDVTNGYIYVSLNEQGSGDSYTYNMDKSPWHTMGGLQVNSGGSPGAWYEPPVPIDFNDRAYDDSQDAYAGASNPSKDGDLLSTMSSGTLRYDGWSLCCFDWETKAGLKDQWGGDLWGPIITPGKGFSLVAANSTGDVTAGDTIKFAPAMTELRAVTKNDCSASLTGILNGLEDVLSMPKDLSASQRNIRSAIGSKPSSTSQGMIAFDGKVVEN